MVVDKEMVNLHNLKNKLRRQGQPVVANEDAAIVEDRQGLEAQLSNRVINIDDGDYQRIWQLNADQAAALHIFYSREDAAYNNLWERYVEEVVGRMTPAERTAHNIRGNGRGGWKLEAPVLQVLRLRWRHWQPASGDPLTSEQPAVYRALQLFRQLLDVHHPRLITY